MERGAVCLSAGILFHFLQVQRGVYRLYENQDDTNRTVSHTFSIRMGADAGYLQ